MYSLIFENESAVVADKPHGWLTTPGRDAADPRPVLGLELQKRAGAQIYPVHRLDFEVSGLVIFAKTAVAHREMQGWFERGDIQKTYQAFSRVMSAQEAAVGAEEALEPGSHAASGAVGAWRVWKSRLARGKKRAFEAAHGKDSLTHARIVSIEREYARWELMPLTGRPHQLRYEMHKHKFPILGDTLYGGAPWTAHGENAIALRAVKLDLERVSERFGLPVSLVASPLN
jgi:tRNA pseudouridine32 synthase / 23S rRNA pseudouridine746 synthase